METKSRKLVLTFGTAANTTLDITITNPDTQIEPEDIKAAMDQIAGSGAFGDGAVADSVVGAKYVIQQVDEVAFA